MFLTVQEEGHGMVTGANQCGVLIFRWSPLTTRVWPISHSMILIKECIKPLQPVLQKSDEHSLLKNGYGPIPSIYVPTKYIFKIMNIR